MALIFAIVAGIVFLAHTLPVPFLLDAMAGGRAVWEMPRTDPPTVYLTYDDGPNPTTTPDLLDVLAAEGVHATFFLIDEHITPQSEPIVRRLFEDGHSVALHSGSRVDMLLPPDEFGELLVARADHIARIAGRRPCRAFRPHAGWRSEAMFVGGAEHDYRMIGWGWMLWDFNWFRSRTADVTVPRLLDRASGGDIIVMHDGDESAPLADQRHTVETTARLIPELRARSFSFGRVCENEE